MTVFIEPEFVPVDQKIALIGALGMSAAWSGMPLTAGKTISVCARGFVKLNSGRLCNTQIGK